MSDCTRGTNRIRNLAGLLLAASIALVALLALPPTLGLTAQTVSIEGGQTLVIEGTDEGDHVRLQMSGGDAAFIVRGFMPGSVPAQCTRQDRQKVLVCPAAGVGDVEVDLGGSDDKVEVLDTLPVPLTALLGTGSDKMIGAGEPDLCYTGGTRRNRCIGGGGDDVCIGDAANGDCVGGPGDDYCKALGGSDGCWGGPGQDVCEMGPGHDGCHGDAGDDRLLGGSSSDQLYGGSGTDYCDGQVGVGRSHDCENGSRH
jgi:Ca2+-binding RTX toxin-like protein